MIVSIKSWVSKIFRGQQLYREADRTIIIDSGQVDIPECLDSYAFVNEDLNGKLLTLANAAWRDRKTGNEFYLDPNALGHPQTENNCQWDGRVVDNFLLRF